MYYMILHFCYFENKLYSSSCQQTLLYQIFRFLELHLLTSPLMISCVQKVHKQGSLVGRAIDLFQL